MVSVFTEANFSLDNDEPIDMSDPEFAKLLEAAMEKMPPNFWKPPKPDSVIGENGFIYSQTYDTIAVACGFDSVADFVYMWELTMAMGHKPNYYGGRRNNNWVEMLVHQGKTRNVWAAVIGAPISRPIPLKNCVYDAVNMMDDLEYFYSVARGVKKVMSDTEKSRKVDLVMDRIVKRTDRLPLPIMAELSDFLESVPDHLN